MYNWYDIHLIPAILSLRTLVIPTLVEPSKEIWLGLTTRSLVTVLMAMSEFFRESRIVLLGPVVYLIIEDNF